MTISRSRRLRSAVAIVMVVAGVLALGRLVALADDPPETSDPVAAFNALAADQEDPFAKVFLLRVKVIGATSKKGLVSAELRYGYGRLQAPGPQALAMEIFYDESPVREVIVVNPAIKAALEHTDGGPGYEVLTEGIGEYTVPFRRDIRTVYISDAVEGYPNTVIINLHPVIDAFCASNASDPDCIARSDANSPKVFWVKPAPGEPLNVDGVPTVVLSIAGTYKLVADATDNAGNPVVTFWSGHEEICVVEAPPYECDWSPHLGLQILRVSARDVAGNSSYEDLEVLAVTMPED